MSAQPKDTPPFGKSHSGKPAREPLRDLQSYPEPFVKTEDLAQYWYVSHRQIYKQIEDGRLPAIRVGPRTVRIPTRDAADFEKRLMLHGPLAHVCLNNEQETSPPKPRGANAVKPTKRRIRR